MNIPNGPGGTVQNPKPTTATVYNISTAANARTLNVRDNVEYLDTTYKGIEFTATKRFTRKWQMQAGFTIGKNEGGVTAAPAAPISTIRTTRASRRASSATTRRPAFRLSGSYELPYAINIAGSLVANNGYPYVSTYSLTRAARRHAGNHAHPRQPDHSAQPARRRAL